MTTQTISVSIVGDLIHEVDEYLTVTLSAPSLVTILKATAYVAIRDDDSPPIPPKSDFNEDGKPDLLWRHTGTGGLAVWLLDGLTRTTEVGLIPFQAPTNLEVVGVADFYLDGTSDILWQDTGTGAVSLWVMNGVTRVAVEPVSPGITDPGWRIRAVADINGDAHPDLLWQHVDGWAAVSMLVGRTVVAVHLLSPQPVAVGWQLVATGDFDRDGHTDLVWQNEQTGDLSWWKLDGHSQVSAGALTPGNVGDLQFKVRGSADFDGDGMSDLVWQHADTGHLSVWLMDGIAGRLWVEFVPSLFGDPGVARRSTAMRRMVMWTAIWIGVLFVAAPSAGQSAGGLTGT